MFLNNKPASIERRLFDIMNMWIQVAGLITIFKFSFASAAIHLSIEKPRYRVMQETFVFE